MCEANALPLTPHRLHYNLLQNACQNIKVIKKYFFCSRVTLITGYESTTDPKDLIKRQNINWAFISSFLSSYLHLYLCLYLGSLIGDVDILRYMQHLFSAIKKFTQKLATICISGLMHIFMHKLLA